MLSHNQSFQKESQNCSLSKIPNIPEQQCMTTQFNIPRQSKVELVTNEQKSSFPEIEDTEQCQQKKGLTKKQKIIISLSLLLVMSGILAGIVAYKVITDKNNSQRATPQIPATYSNYESKIIAGQQNNLIKIIHVPQSQRIYDYEIVNNRIIKNIDSSSQAATQSSSYRFGVVCLNVNETEFDMILYFIESKIPTSQNSTLLFQDYPPVQNNQDNNSTSENGKPNTDNVNHFDSSNLNQLSNLSQQEIQILKSKNIDPQDFLKSNLPIIRFQVLKSGQISSIQKPLNMRYDLQQIILNLLEQISPIVLKDYYNLYQSTNDGNKRMLKARTQKFIKRVLNNENVPVNLEASVTSNLAGQFSKSYSDLQNDQDTQHQTSYNQVNSFQNGALESSDVKSTVKLSPSKDDSDQSQQIFQGMQVQSQGQISFVSQQDEVDPQFLQQLEQDFEDMLKYNLSWEQAQELQNKVQKFENQNDITSNAGRLLQSQPSNQKVVGKAIQSNIFKNQFASIDLQSDYYSECDQNSTVQQINCYSGFIGKFQGKSQQLQQQNISQTYSNGSIDKRVQQLNYVKNNVYNLMGNVTQQVSNQVQAAIDLINSLISRSSSFQNNVIQNLSNITNQNIQILNNTMNGFNAFTYNYSVSVINATSSFVKKYNDSLLSQYPAYVNLVNITFNNTVIEFDSRIAKLRSLINNIIQNNLTISKNTYNALKNITDNEYLYFSIAFNQSQYWQPGYICSLAQQTLNVTNFIQQNSNMDIYNQSVANYTPIWSQIRTNVTNGTSTKLQINLYNNFAAVLASAYVKSGPSVYLTYPVTVFSNQAQFQSSPFAIFYTTSSNQYAQGGIDDSALVDTIHQSEQASDLDNQVAQLQQLFDTPIDFRSTYQSFLNDFYQLLKNFTNDESAAQPQYQNYILDWMTQGYNYSFSLPKLLQEANLNVISSLNQTIPIVQNEYDQQTAILNNTSSQILSQIGSIYNTVTAFLSNTTYPDNDPLNNQTPPNDTQFNNTVFGITNDYLAQQLNQLSNLLPQLHTVVDNLTNYGPQIQSIVNNMTSFLQGYKIQLPQIPQAIFTPTFQTVFKTLISNYVSGFSIDANRALNNLNLNTSNIANIQQFYSRLNSFVSTDMQSTFAQSILQQQSSMSQLYFTTIANIQNQKPVSTNKTSFGNLQTINNPYQKNLISQNYTYVYPCPLGYSIKLSLQVNWTTGIQTFLTTQDDILSFKTQSNINIQTMGTFSALFAIVEIGGYAQGNFLNATLNSSINANVTNNSGQNNLTAQYGATNIQIEQYITIYIQKYITICQKSSKYYDDDDDDYYNNSSYKSSVASTLFSDANYFCGKVSKQKCKTTVQTVAVQIDLLDPINFYGKAYNKTLINQSY
ncbi:transmembrane protein, putative (macronuclear) [Tetrahymena thermophila SB210]|uniref:Transmembrane protein, putative n=1 Tax=Tetrahymena thermophila (strain SB210) TaxID=312017 RepID=I7M698_TETTS|nr:transmembrane protein, putative [Tetrahymena thermophila SB210]EAR84813.1 transmembrane protein, putative [Tetrahymena thermophila SB210]|eukprot:XP_001032476.1 transmembrane protein, putative [Tetrahymena thermophila SB210]